MTAPRIQMPIIHVERQPDGQYLACDEAGPIVWHATQSGASGLARVARPGQQVLIGRRGKWQRWQSGHVARRHSKAKLR